MKVLVALLFYAITHPIIGDSFARTSRPCNHPLRSFRSCLRSMNLLCEVLEPDMVHSSGATILGGRG
jgi:hypothetical protein